MERRHLDGKHRASDVINLIDPNIIGKFECAAFIAVKMTALPYARARMYPSVVSISSGVFKRLGAIRAYETP